MEQFVNESDVAVRKQLVMSIIYAWTGVEGIDPNSRAATRIYGNAIGDARKLEALEELLGEEYVGTWCWNEKDPNPHGQATPLLLSAFNKLVTCVYSQLIAQTDFKELYSKTTLTWDDKTNSVKLDLSGVTSEILTRISSDPEEGKALLRQFIANMYQLQILDIVNFEIFREAFVSKGFTEYAHIIDAANKVEMVGTSEKDSLTGTNENEAIWGFEGNDTISGGNGEDILDGGEGNDKLYGNSGDDILVGEEGDDYLEGGSGNDTYIFRKGYGKDTICEYDYTKGNIDKLIMGEGIEAKDIKIRKNGSDLELILEGTEDQVTVTDYFRLDSCKVEEIEFADGTKWDVDYVKKALLIGNDENNRLYGYNEDNDEINGLGGEDTIYGYNGNDKLYGGSGDDKLYGGNGEDILDGGIGNDYLQGEYGNDTYIFRKGYGKDTIHEYDDTNGNIDKLIMGEGIEAKDIKIRKNVSDLELILQGTENQVTVRNYFSSDSYKVEEIEFADGTKWDVDYVKKAVLIGDDENNLLYGYNEGNDEIKGLGGKDTIYGYNGNDKIDGGSEDDKLYGGNDDDEVIGGTGDDELYGENGNDTLLGEEGNDYLDGGSGSDVYEFSKGFGKDTIYDNQSNEQEVDKIKFTDIASNEVSWRVSETSTSDLELRISGTEDTITLKDYFINSSMRMEQIEFADGEVWNKEIIDDKFKNMLLRGTEMDETLKGSNVDNIQYEIYGLGGDDKLHGGTGDNKLYGGIGDDELYGGTEDDVLEGGEGNDVLYGREGNNVYVYNVGDGRDSIFTSYNSEDVLRLGEGIDQHNIDIVMDGADVIIKTETEEDQIKIVKWYEGNKLDRIEFKNGSVLTAEEIEESLYDMPYQGEGNNTYVYNVGDGRHTVTRIDPVNIADNIQVLRLGEGINQQNIDIVRDGVNLVIKTEVEEDQIIIEDWYKNSIQRIEFADGNTLDMMQIINEVYGGDDEIYGSSEGDVIRGLLGNDRIYGNEGDDYLIGDEGNDYLNGGAGNDFYEFSGSFGEDTINNYDSDTNSTDKIGFMSNYSDLIFERNENDMVIKINGTNDKVTIESWYSGGDYQVENIMTNYGHNLQNTQVDQLIQAMATFTQNTGMSWSEAINEKPDEVREVIGQYFVSSQSI
ncbi:calcium-binding protein [Clostridium sp. ZS2-4]|uniref:calcium-binding protein n=1 Tax=Clostridium sp. ZS2-4 TaxID=2987703 RepID=UPI00227B30FD|nr:calcium-binding protein [Clostridium sp. ZS2-4]MCY6355658.1 hypothetical protein [Clostridium sp. ZS2-4]